MLAWYVIGALLWCQTLVTAGVREHCVVVESFEGAKTVIPDEELLQLQSFEFNVIEDLLGFTGLNESEVRARVKRENKFHLAYEHAFWGPRSSRELAWYYRGSVSYLFANALHPANQAINGLEMSDGPVLDYSGGTGSNVLTLAKRGVQTYYFGIGMPEFEFARYRARKYGLQDLITFLDPYSRTSRGFLFDPANAVPNVGFGTIMLFDVLEHIPDYHLTLRHLIKTLRKGGTIMETSPFNKYGQSNDIHLKASMPMEEAMGPTMKFVKQAGDVVYWQKVSDSE